MLFILFFSILFNFTIIISGSLQHELQLKINSNIPVWISKQIAEDLRDFSAGITRDKLLKTFTNNKGKKLLVYYKIQNNKLSIVYLDKDVKSNQIANLLYTDFTSFIETLTKLVKLPNVEFLFYPYDWPGDTLSYVAPVFSFSKKLGQDSTVVLVPDVQSIGNAKTNIIQKVNLGSNKFPWKVKQNKAIWRGATTGDFYTFQNYNNMPRVSLVKLSLKYPLDLDARFHHLWEMNLDLKNLFNKFGYAGNTIAVEDHLKYKYQILIDGNTASWGRGYWQLFSNSVILKQESPWTMWYYADLKPYVHYIPFSYNCENLIEQINWARNNDMQCQNMTINANNFAKERLKYVDLFYYMYILLNEYVKLQKF